MYSICPETDEDWWEVEALYDLCFAPGREALSSYRLREDVPQLSDLSLLARDADGILAGAIRFWPVLVSTHPVLLLGPIAVHPTRQGEGLGRLLIQSSLETAAKAGWDRVLLVGDAPYYERLGFIKLTGVEFPPPTNPDRVMGYALTDQAWGDVTGEVRKWSGPLH